MDCYDRSFLAIFLIFIACKCPNAEFLVARIFPNLVRIPEKDYKEFRIQTFFTLFTLSFMEKKHFVCFSLYLEVALSSFGFYFVFKHGS